MISGMWESGIHCNVDAEDRVAAALHQWPGDAPLAPLARLCGQWLQLRHQVRHLGLALRHRLFAARQAQSTTGSTTVPRGLPGAEPHRVPACSNPRRQDPRRRELRTELAPGHDRPGRAPGEDPGARTALWFVGAVALVVAACAVLAAQLRLRPRLGSCSPTISRASSKLRRLHSRWGGPPSSIVVEGRGRSGEAGRRRHRRRALVAGRRGWWMPAPASASSAPCCRAPGSSLDRGELERTLGELESAWSEQVLEEWAWAWTSTNRGHDKGGFKGLAVGW